LIAAVLICLSVTALAAAGNYIPRWLGTDTEETIGYDNDLYIGSASKNWELEGWLMELKAEAASATGLTMVCTEWGGQKQAGTLTADDTYWLEKWDGSGYDIYLPEKAPTSSGNTVTVMANTTLSWPINWEACYGALVPGSYRLGKTFRHTSDSGQIQDMIGYVKFRVLEADMATYYTQYETALKTLSAQHSWHLAWQVFPEDSNEYTSYSLEIWKDGENYLENLCYLDADGAVLRHSGITLQDGMGYRLTWDDGTVHADITQCKSDDSVQSRRFYLWQTFFTLTDARISKITREENTVVYTEYREDPTETTWETALTLNEAGQIASIRQYRLDGENKTLYSVLTVFDTDATQIARTIADQLPDSFAAE